MDRLPEDCIKYISRFLTPSEQDHLITLTLLSMDDFIMCVHCGVNVASWEKRCYDCHINAMCPECCLVPNQLVENRYLQPVGVYRMEPNVCKKCYEYDIPYFTCLFCQISFFAFLLPT